MLRTNNQTYQQQQNSDVVRLQVISHRQDLCPAPLSYAQQQLWYLAQLEPDSPLHNMADAVRIHGSLCVAVLQQALDAIAYRHEILHTNFEYVDNYPVQVIAAPQPAELTFIDLRSLCATDREIEAQSLLRKEARQIFDLKKGNLWRATLLQLDAEEFILLLTNHQLILDRWSIGVFWRELAALYQAFASSQPSSLPELPVQYADFAHWQRQWLDEVIQSQLTYWKQRLSGNLQLELPTDRPRPPLMSFRGARHFLKLPQALTEALKQLSQREGVTLYMTLLAAFKTLLYRYSGQTDILVGSPIANRKQVELQQLIGCFANTLVMRTDLSGNPTYRELLSQVREVALEAYAHQDLPFEKLVEELHLERDLSRSPLFQVMFALQNATMPALEMADMTLSPLEVDNGTAQFDLLLDLSEHSDAVSGYFEYNTDLFDAATIARMSGHLQTLLEGIVAHPEQRLGELPLLSAAQQHQLLVSWNDTSVEYSQDVCIHQMFEATVERNPDAVAAVFDQEQLTYRELNYRANCLAHHLQALGVKPDVLVGICVERSLEMIVGLLGILKAGGAYVPLDPAYPKERLAFMLSDSQVSVLLTQKNLVAGLPEQKAYVVCLDTDWGVISQKSKENPVSSVTAENLAYIIYTSGSMGRPRGVMIQHRSVLNLSQGLHKAIYAHYGDCRLRVSVNGSLAFDTSVKQIIQLLHGHTLDIVPEALRFDGSALLSYLRRSNIDVFDCTPSQLGLLISAGLLDGGAAPTSVLVGGEAINESTWQTLVQAENINFYNVYGPTECTVDATVCSVRMADLKPVIGRPITNTQLYILDRNLQSVPIGVPGELHIGGAGLARGYLNRPELTAEKFIPNCFSDEPGARLYKTGDLVRYNSDGNIEFLGRIDNQVKIRGFRIELGEIEAVLTQHPDVREGVVIVREDVPGDSRLVAYLVPHQKQAPTVNELRSFLKEKLPSYMVPSAFVFLESLPLTPNGKVDRRALPAPNIVNQLSEKTYLAPQTPVEEVLAAIWAEVLKLDQVGVQDNFFELGGHSLNATQLVSRIREAFQIELPMRHLFEQPTVAGLAKRIETDSRAFQRLQIPPIQRIPHLDPIPASFAQQRLWFLQQLGFDNASYNIPVVLRILGPLNIATLEQSFNEICLRHAALRTTFSTHAGQPIQVISPPKLLPMDVVDFTDIPAVERESRALQMACVAAGQPFDLVHGPLIRAKVLRLSQENHLLLLTIHHIISDGWSTRVLMQELAVLYDAFSKVLPSPLPELPIQYADFAHWQRQWLQGEVLQPQLDYWKQQLGGSLPVLELPTDRPRPPVQTFTGAQQTLVIPQPLSSALKRLSREQGVTLYMTLLAAFQTLLHRYTGQSDILVGSPIANRNSVETEGLIGFFVNTLVMRTDLSGNPTFQDLLAAVREVALGAYAHQNVPFEKLVEELQPERDSSRNPLFQVMFTLHNTPMPALEMAEVTLERVNVHNGTSKLDLTLEVNDTDQGLVGMWEYNTDLFDATTITRMAENFQTLLEGIVSCPNSRVSHLPILSADERQTLLVSWNQTEAEYSLDVCIHQLFEAAVSRTPDKVAVVFENQQLTYAQLNQQAVQVANYLTVSCGVGGETFVGICLERSLFMVVGLLAILKAGGTYVPIDPRYPQERIAFVLEDTNAPVLLTQASVVANLPTSNARVICLDTDWEVIATQDKQNILASVTPQNLAYVIYTSGSTGKPKGVQIEHRAVVNFLTSMKKKPGLTDQDILLSVTTLSFDIAVLEIFLPLTVGASLVIASSEVTYDGVALQRLLLDSGATIMQATPATMRLLHEAGWRGSSDLKILCGGEPMPKALAEQLLARVGSLWNMYGPTETTIWSTVHQVEEHSLVISIGRPIANTSIYLLDTYGQPVPIGVPGELHIGGVGLARGYLNRPELTAEKFIHHPYSDKPEARLYKTGDLARYLPCGNIECLGRIDHQVKIRGFRMELGEIEAVLDQHPTVRQTVVIAREDVPGEKRLVAYIVPHQKQTPTVSELRSFLKEKLPEYMVPSAFVFLEALPLTPNGKVDRRELPAPEQGSPELERTFVAPRNPVEEVLAGIWAEVLKLDHVGIYNNFFDLGGHSLLATQVMARVRDTFKVELPLRCLFEAPTVAELSTVAIANEAKPGQTEKIARVLKKLKGMSALEVMETLQKKKTTKR